MLKLVFNINLLNSIFNINLLNLEKKGQKTHNWRRNYVKMKFLDFSPKARQSYIPESGNIRPDCRAYFHFRNIQSSQSCFWVFFKMTLLTFWCFSCFLIIFLSKLSIGRPRQQTPNFRKVIKVDFWILDLDFQRFSGGRFSNLQFFVNLQKFINFCKFTKFT